jgi:hypothetical protein
VRAAPAVSCAMGSKEDAHEQTGSAEAVRPSLRNGLTAYAVFSLVTGFLTPSPPEGVTPRELDACSRGVRTTRFCRRQLPPHVARSRAQRRGQRPPQPAPTFVTFASAPLAGQDGRITPVICGQNQAEIPKIGTSLSSLRGAQRRSNPFFSCDSGLLRGACHRAGIRPTRWLAMTGIRLPPQAHLSAPPRNSPIPA